MSYKESTEANPSLQDKNLSSYSGPELLKLQHVRKSPGTHLKCSWLSLRICISARDLGVMHTAGGWTTFGVVRGLQAIWGWRVSPQSRRTNQGIMSEERLELASWNQRHLGGTSQR